MNNLLAFSMENLGNGLFVFILGLLIVFFGIAVIVLVISVIGKIMSAKKKKSEAQKNQTVSEQPATTEEGLTPETVAAITAVLSAYYFSNESNCEFKIKKIKRIY